jgi:hypothetical protein
LAILSGPEDANASENYEAKPRASLQEEGRAETPIRSFELRLGGRGGAGILTRSFGPSVAGRAIRIIWGGTGGNVVSMRETL